MLTWRNRNDEIYFFFLLVQDKGTRKKSKSFVSYEEKKTTLPIFAEDKNVFLEIRKTQQNPCLN